MDTGRKVKSHEDYASDEEDYTSDEEKKYTPEELGQIVGLNLERYAAGMVAGLVNNENSGLDYASSGQLLNSPNSESNSAVLIRSGFFSLQEMRVLYKTIKYLKDEQEGNEERIESALTTILCRRLHEARLRDPLSNPSNQNIERMIFTFFRTPGYRGAIEEYTDNLAERARSEML